MASLAALVIGLIALIIAPGFLFYFDVTPKVAILFIGSAGLLMVVVRSRTLVRGPRLLAGLLLLNAASLAVSTAFSTNRSLSLYGSTWRSFGAAAQAVVMLLTWLIAWICAGRPDRARVILRGLSLVGIVSAAYGIAQYLGWDPLLAPASYRVGEGIWTIVRPPGTLGYASYFATWMLITVFLSLALAKMESHRVWRAVALSAAVLALGAMLLTGTRAALLGLLAGGIAWLWWSGFRVPRRVIAALGLLIICVAAFYFSPAGLQMRSRTRWFVEDPWGGARPLLWRDSLAMGIKKPLAGYGPEVFLGTFPLFESKALSEAYPDFVHESPHNIFLDALVSQGLPGLLLWCGLCAAGFVAAWRLKALQPSTAGWLAAALAAGIVSQQFTAFTMPTAVIFLTTVAVAAGLATEGGMPRGNAVLSAAAPFLAIGMLYLAARIVMADHTLEATRQLMDSPNLRAATAKYEEYWFWHLPGTGADVWYSRSWMDVARKTQDKNVEDQALAIAAQSAMRATDGAEEPFAAWYNLAQISAQRDDYRTTETSLFRAIGEHPNWFKPHWLLAQELELVGRSTEAEQQAVLAVELDGGHHPEVAQTLQEIRGGGHVP